MINERVEVLVRFGEGKVIPVSFEWKNREYRVKSVPLIFERSDGGRKYLCFSVETGGMMVELRWDLQNFQFSITQTSPL